MIRMQDSAIEPGDIVFVISHRSDFVTRLKRAVQSITTPQGKHGHREVVSVFVCSGKNDFGLICHNHEGELGISEEKMRTVLEKLSPEELIALVLDYCDKLLTVAQIKAALSKHQGWIAEFARNIKDDDPAEKIRDDLLAKIKNNKKELNDVLLSFWQISGQSLVLLGVNSSLLVFKHRDPQKREQFLNVYKEQVKVTERYTAQNKSRTSWWSMFTSLFKTALQDKKDTDPEQSPSDATYCARNVIQALNKADPTLVARGRHVTPKSLEAGMRAATKMREAAVSDVIASEEDNDPDDFEALLERTEKLLPPFRMNILPVAGKDFIKQLLQMADNEYKRISNKAYLTGFDRHKLSEIKSCLQPYRDPKFQNYPISLQVDVALELLAKLLPILKKKRSGLFENWFPTKAYAKLRTFARTQGIFDGDIRDAAAKLAEKAKVSETTKPDVTTQSEVHKDSTKTQQLYIFSDWSLSNWTAHKREQMISHMSQLLAEGHQLYAWKNGKLSEMNDLTMQAAIRGEDLDEPLAMDISPEINSIILKEAKQQGLGDANIHHLDYRQCQLLCDDKQAVEACIDNAAKLFSPKLDNYHLKQTKLDIIDTELANAADNETEQAVLLELRERIAAIELSQQSNYRSGIDTNPKVRQSGHAKPIFQALGLTNLSPPVNYYRHEVYSQLAINDNPDSHFHYFELQGMTTKDLKPCEYIFHADGLSNALKQQRKSASSQSVFEGKYTLSLDGDWHALPSVHPEEILMDVAIKGLTAADIEIKYSEASHLYYIRMVNAKTPKQIELNYLLQMPKQYRTHPVFNTLIKKPKHQDIQKLLMKYLGFGKDLGKLSTKIGESIHNGKQYLAEARQQTVGSCRLRAIAFKDEMMQKHPEIPVSIVVNPIHCFIEMKLDGKWRSYCLGGYSNTPTLSEILNNVSVQSTSSKMEQSAGHRFFGGKKQQEVSPQQDLDKNQHLRSQ